ncbi:uncharacterized protein LOC108588084 isoform X1 [Callithrix jacchus]
MAEEVSWEEASGVGRTPTPTPTPGALRAPPAGSRGERPDEGHGPDAAARASAGDRGRPPQGQRRPVTVSTKGDRAERTARGPGLPPTDYMHESPASHMKVQDKW